MTQETITQNMDPVSAALLQTVPRKIYAWVNSLPDAESYLPIGKFGMLSWNFNDNGYIELMDIGAFKIVTIGWHGSPTDAKNIKCTAPWADNVVENLEEFTAFEKTVYHQLHLLDSYLESEVKQRVSNAN